jgi:hypothetical protein
MQALSDFPATVSREIFATLRGLLPPPATDTPEARAVRIRAERGLPKCLDFGPPEPAIVDATDNGTSPIMRALDQRQHAEAAA